MPKIPKATEKVNRCCVAKTIISA